MGAHLDTPTIAEVSCSLSLRGTSGERAGGEGLVPSNCRALLNPLSLTLSPILRRGERESAAGVVVVSRCAQTMGPRGRGMLRCDDAVKTRINGQVELLAICGQG